MKNEWETSTVTYIVTLKIAGENVQSKYYKINIIEFKT